MSVRLIAVTRGAEGFMASLALAPESESPEHLVAYMARVSNPNNQDSPETEKLLTYCIKHKHWSIFEMANMVVEIKTSRAISAQILRHRSFSFQEFSQRYSEVDQSPWYSLPRRQDTKNRQNSFDDLPVETLETWCDLEDKVFKTCEDAYQKALGLGIARESARFLLPLASPTTVYMNGTVRSWLHYLDLRCAPETQWEHREIAQQIKNLFINQFPITSKAMGWEEQHETD